MKIVIYFRTKPSDPASSNEALTEQRATVTEWLAHHDATPITESIERETDAPARPALAQAITACKTHDASLLIASTDPIGGGEPFVPRIASVPVHIAPSPVKPPQEIIPLPRGGPSSPFIYVHQHPCLDTFQTQVIRSRPAGMELRTSGCILRPIYLCNPGPNTLRDLTVRTGGVTIHDLPKPLQTSTTEEHFDTLHPGTGRLIGLYDLIFDGDFITWYAVNYVEPGGSHRKAQAIIDKGGPTSRFVPIQELPHDPTHL